MKKIMLQISYKKSKKFKTASMRLWSRKKGGDNKVVSTGLNGFLKADIILTDYKALIQELENLSFHILHHHSAMSSFCPGKQNC